jgi:hypothetical protein
MGKPKFVLNVESGIYEADSLFSLMMEVIRHRLWHWRRGDGWID